MGKIPEHTISAFVDTKEGNTNPGQSHSSTSSAAYNVYEIKKCNKSLYNIQCNSSSNMFPYRIQCIIIIVALICFPIGYSPKHIKR